MKQIIVFLIILAGIITGCKDQKQEFISHVVENSTEQTKLMLSELGEPTGKNSPRTANTQGNLSVTSIWDWTSGFFPGSLWYLYELTGEEWWKEQAERWTYAQEPVKDYTGNHDIGFMMYCSYGNAWRLAPKEEYKDILVYSANTLLKRYSDEIGLIKSWNGGSNWDRTIKWSYPVIIDNMMNLELLFFASKITGEKRYYDAAVRHADATLKNQIRDDYTIFHVVDYNPETGEVNSKATAQGYSDNSTWARGQAWAVYGYTLMYRETKDEKYLQAAEKLADVFIKHMGDDYVTLWDFNVGEEGYRPGEKSYAVNFKEKLKDSSAASIVCSALFELGQYLPEKGYIDMAIKMLHSLGSEKYLAKPGENAYFIIKHSVGSIPHKSEIDVPLVYTDYYFLEALVRYRNLK